MSRIVTEQKFTNLVQTVVLVAAMGSLLAAAGFLLFGPWGVATALAMAAAAAVFGPSLSPHWILRMYGARRLSPFDAPPLFAIVAELTNRASLPATPRLYYVASRSLNAFAVGHGDEASIAVTDGLLRKLEPRELQAVLAHELSHLRHRDLRVMGLADIFSRMTASLARLGLLLTVISLPAWMSSPFTGWFFALLLLMAAPTFSGLLQLALSRSREFAADVGAAELTGDPLALASALRKIEHSEPHGMLRRVLYPQGDPGDASLLRSHPPTEERIRRLVEMAGGPASPPPPPPPPLPRELLTPQGTRPVLRTPRFHFLTGLWY